jgi:hypothetical protein
MAKKTRGRGFMDENKETIDKAYDATATLGKVSTIIGTIFGNIILLIFVIIGIVLIRKKNTMTSQVNGKVTEAKCIHEGKTTNCNGTIEYEVNGTKYKKDFTTTKVLNKGDVKVVKYDPSDPNVFAVDVVPVKAIGWIMVIVCGLFMVASWIWLWFVMTFKLAAAATGVGAVTDMVIPDGQ